MRARGMRVAREREPADQLPVRTLGDEDRRVRETPHRFQISALVADRPPLAVGGDEPSLRLAAHVLREPRQFLRIVGMRGTHDEVTHATTTPAPPRRGSPAAASAPSARTSTALTPPKY